MEMVKADQEVNEVPALEQKEMKESFQIQKSIWVRERLEKKREQEDRLLAQIEQEQELLRNIDENINAGIEHSSEGRAYRQDIQDRIEQQVYEMHDLSRDKLEGIREYQNAYHRGFALAMFLLSVALTTFAGYLDGATSQICLVMLSFTAVQSAVLVHNDRGVWVWRAFCKLINMILFPMMLVLFIFFELKNPLYEMLLFWSVCATLLLLVLFTLVYFLYDPYQAAKTRINDARVTLQTLEKQAKKQVKRNQKTRIRESDDQEKLQRREQTAEDRMQKRNEARSIRLAKYEEWKKKIVSSFQGLRTHSQQEELLNEENTIQNVESEDSEETHAETE